MTLSFCTIFFSNPVAVYDFVLDDTLSLVKSNMSSLKILILSVSKSIDSVSWTSFRCQFLLFSFLLSTSNVLKMQNDPFILYESHLKALSIYMRAIFARFKWKSIEVCFKMMERKIIIILINNIRCIIFWIGSALR